MLKKIQFKTQNKPWVDAYYEQGLWEEFTRQRSTEEEMHEEQMEGGVQITKLIHTQSSLKKSIFCWTATVHRLDMFSKYKQGARDLTCRNMDHLYLKQHWHQHWVMRFQVQLVIQFWHNWQCLFIAYKQTSRIPSTLNNVLTYPCITIQ